MTGFLPREPQEGSLSTGQLSSSKGEAEDKVMLRRVWHDERDWAFHPPFGAEGVIPAKSPQRADEQRTQGVSMISHVPMQNNNRFALCRYVPLLPGYLLPLWGEDKFKKAQGETTDFVRGVNMEWPFQRVTAITNG